MATPDTIDLLGICASPRQGNTLFLLQKALATASTFPESGRVAAELIELRARRIGACTGCEACARMKGECVISDDFQAIRDRWVKADVVLYATPVYHLGIPGQLKCFIDRLGNSQRKAHEVPSPRRLKVVGVITQGSHLFAGQELTIAFLHQHAVLLNCIPISGDGWESYLGAAGWTRGRKEMNALEEEYAKEEMDARVAVRACETLVLRCLETAFILKAGGRALKEKLAGDPAYGVFLRSLEKREFQE